MPGARCTHGLSPSELRLHLNGLLGMRRKLTHRWTYRLPYSPDLNPIEQVFAKLKHLMRAAEPPRQGVLWIVRTGGGLSTKIHMAVRGLGCPVRFTLTAGQTGDAPQAAALIEGLPADVVMADTAYDADHLRQAVAAKGAIAVIPNNPSRALKHPLDKHFYAQRYLVECCFSKLKQFRRVATRFEKTARNYHAVVTLAAIMLWLR